MRADGHYCRPEVMDWCEANGVDCVSGLTSFNGIDGGINGRSVLSLGLTPLNLLVFRLDLGYRF